MGPMVAVSDAISAKLRHALHGTRSGGSAPVRTRTHAAFIVSMDLALFTLLSLTGLFSAEAWTPSEGRPRVIGSQQPIVGVLGDDVVLPCRLEPALNAEELTVEWSKPDLKSDRLSRVEYVMVYRNRDEVLDMKSRSFFRRTALFEEELKHGNISLKILNVTLEDQGRYRCHIPKLDSQWKDWTVQLVVEPERTTDSPLHPRNLQTSDPQTKTKVKGGRTHLGLLILLVLVLLVLGGGYFLERHRKQNSSKVLKMGSSFLTEHVQLHTLRRPGLDCKSIRERFASSAVEHPDLVAPEGPDRLP